jgi:tetratricopeptide (TPR) repeat protein
MSLLLDALKKAAEQKAVKDSLPTASSDETILDPPLESITELEEKKSKARQAAADAQLDRTEIENTDLDTRFQQTEFEADRTEIESTGLDTHNQQTEYDLDKTEIENTDLDTRFQQSELESDRTDIEDTALDTYYQRTENESDKTEIESDKTEIDSTELQFRSKQGEYEVEETELEIPESETIYQLAGDETQVSTEAGGHEEDDTQSVVFDEDQTVVFDDEEVTNFMGDPLEEVRRRDFTLTSKDADQELTEHQQQTELTDDFDSDGDISLTLIKDREDETNTLGPGSIEEGAEVQLLKQGSTSGNSLSLVEIPDDGAAFDRTTTLPGDSTVTSTSQATLTAQMGSGGQDSTSTNTYAPDNYDRTLMKLPNDDESKIFAGMKSDADVVMTPDYAKKVFRSKSSAQRFYYYKIYAGIAAVILLTIGIFGLFELQDESEIIDISMRPLKIDPMPGIFNSTNKNDESANLFAETNDGVDQKTIALVQNANLQGGSTTDAPASDSETEVDASAIEEKMSVTSGDSQVAKQSQPTQNDVLVSKLPATASSEATTMVKASVVANTQQASSSNLQISSTKRKVEKDVLLQDAYQAYQSGNDELAMVKYNQVLDIDPKNRNALLARAAINVQNDNSRAALEDYQTILIENPNDSLAMTSMIAVARVTPREAESRLKLMIRDDPESPHLNFALANVYGAQKRWPEAQSLYFKALENNPGDPNYAYNLAVSLEHIAKPGVAVSYYQRALNNINNGLATFNAEVVSQRLEMLAKP